jgi:hypothetical protein
MRREFAIGLLFGLRVVWPVLSALVAVIVVLGLLAGLMEGWSISESIYFAFVSGLTIGYGDLAPKTLVARLLAIAIGVCGVLVTGLVAAVAVKALSAVREGIVASDVQQAVATERAGKSAKPPTASRGR